MSFTRPWWPRRLRPCCLLADEQPAPRRFYPLPTRDLTPERARVARSFSTEPFGEDLAAEVVEALESGSGRGLARSQSDAQWGVGQPCGFGLAYEPGTGWFTHGLVASDTWSFGGSCPGGPPAEYFLNREEFVQWLAEQSDFSLA